MNKLRAFFLQALFCICLPVSIQALGFGVPVLKSHLNEVLDVRVPLLLAEGESLNNVFVEFAKPNEYRLVGLEPYTNLSGMRISVEHMKHGEPYVMLSSVSVVQAPIISLLLKARVGRNTHYKQVQVLLDTMGLGAKTHAVKHQQARTPLAMGETIAKNNAEQGWARAWRYGPVRSGDSLSTIAYRLRRDKQWSNHDVMLALYRFNSDAFIQHDINRLKSGVWLEIPHDEILKKLLKQAPEPYEKPQRILEPLSKKMVKPVAKPETVLHKVKKDGVTSQLRYVGRIALGKVEAVSPSESEISSGKASAQLQDKLNQLYQQAMDDHLQMAGLDQNIIAIRDDIGKLSGDIIALKEQQNIMQQQMVESPSSQYWMQGFLLLVLLNSILLGLFLYNRSHAKKKEKYNIEDTYFKKNVKESPPVEEAVAAPAKKEVRNNNLLENKMYDIENYLNLRDYEAVENIFTQLSQGERNHFGICALKVRLHHEMDRLGERDELIRNRQASLDDREWRLLCDRLPINVWHALQESGVIKDNGTLLNVEDSLVDHSRGEEVPKIEILPAGQEGLNELQSDTIDMDTAQVMPISENSLENTDFLTLTPEIIDMSDDFLELNDNELKAMGGETAPTPEDEFVSTVFITAQGGKEKLSKGSSE